VRYTVITDKQEARRVGVCIEIYSKSTNVSALKLLKDKGELIIPDVQRELVWSKSQNQLLIDSLFKDFDIPKIYFRDTEKDGKRVYAVIDGQQRLNAIFSFLSDQYELPMDADDVEHEKVAGKKWSDLSTSLQIQFYNQSVDVVHLIGYTDEEIDETFLRLQNGTPLKAAEKRRAIAGNMRNVISELAKHDIFRYYCAFANQHFAFEDVTAKVMKQIIEGKASNISAPALKRLYEQNPYITMDDKVVKDTRKAFDFIKKAFKKTQNPHLKRYAVIDLAVIANSLLKVYDLSNYAEQFGETFLRFTDERILNAEKPEEEQDQRLIRYSNATRGDSLEYLEYRQKILREYILEEMPYLERKDQIRIFTPDQRAVIYRKGKGICAECGIAVSEESFEADHIKPWSKGGRTIIANGQILCSVCNHRKSNKFD